MCLPSVCQALLLSRGEGEKRRKRRVEREKRKSKSERVSETQTDRQIREVVVLQVHHSSLFICPLSFVRISASKVLATSPRPCSLVLFREHFSYSFWIVSGYLSSLFLVLILPGLVRNYTFGVFCHRLPPGVCL